VNTPGTLLAQRDCLDRLADERLELRARAMRVVQLLAELGDERGRLGTEIARFVERALDIAEAYVAGEPMGEGLDDVRAR